MINNKQQTTNIIQQTSFNKQKTTENEQEIITIKTTNIKQEYRTMHT